jgi:PAS domain S-box-containing protein
MRCENYSFNHIILQISMSKIDHSEILEGMFTDATEGIIVCNRQGQIILSNPRAQLMFGYDDGEMNTLTMENLMPSELVTEDSRRADELNGMQAIAIEPDIMARKRDGTRFPAEISLSEVKSKSDMLTVAFIMDITERKKKDDELRMTNEKLKKTSFKLSRLNQELEQKVEERTLELAEMIRKLTKSKKEADMALQKEKELNNLKSRFISTASHEFRTPLATIMSSVALTGKYAESLDKEMMIKHIERVKNSVNHLTDILNDFLSLDKLEEGVVMAHPENIFINQLVNDIIEEIKGIAKEGQRITYDGLEGSEETYIDGKILRNIMVNLISNAIKYSNENTFIEIKARNDQHFLFIDIRDQGIGIPYEDQPHIFDRFYRANNIGNMQGTGLGLNIVKKYVEILSGEITFKSKPDKGTKFSLKIPI